MKISDHESALEVLEDAWKMRRMTLDAPGLSSFARRRTLHKSHQRLEQAAEFFRKTGAHRELVNALRRLGHVEQDMGDKSGTLERYLEAVEVSRIVGDTALHAHTVRHLGDLHRRSNETDKAEQYYREALELYASLDEAPDLDYANALRPMALLLESSGRHPEARALWEKARTHYAGARLADGVDECSYHLRKIDEQRNRGENTTE